MNASTSQRAFVRRRVRHLLRQSRRVRPARNPATKGGLAAKQQILPGRLDHGATGRYPLSNSLLRIGALLLQRDGWIDSQYAIRSSIFVPHKVSASVILRGVERVKVAGRAQCRLEISIDPSQCPLTPVDETR